MSYRVHWGVALAGALAIAVAGPLPGRAQEAPPSRLKPLMPENPSPGPIGPALGPAPIPGTSSAGRSPSGQPLSGKVITGKPKPEKPTPTKYLPSKPIPDKDLSLFPKKPAPAKPEPPKPQSRLAPGPAKAKTAAASAADNPALTTGSLAGGEPRTPSLTGDADFAAFLRGLWPVARAHGVTKATFDMAFQGVEPDPRIAELTRKQAEFVKPVWSYLDGAVSDQRIQRGREMAARWGETLAAVEARYGVDRRVVLGVWGLETNFGSFTGGKDVIRSLATLGAMGYRGSYFRDELVTALLILQQRHVSREDMKGSWAGAMGQTQFMPSSFMRFAVDADGDGHKDIWTSVPDALASTANYLHRNGWKTGLPWGMEVRLPARFDWRAQKGSFAHWAALGVRRADGGALPASGEASLFLPAGAHGPVFLVTANFAVIKRYNASDAYALGVAHLGDRVAGAGPILAEWPTDEPPLDRSQRVELQQRLAALGYDIGEADGRLGSKTREALRDFQSRRGFVPDGYPGPVALDALRAAR
jgi:membrane-bound lytic murein transglycosylase B